MSEGSYKIRNQSAIHFITFAVVEWVDVFTRKQYRDILLDSIKFCQSKKGLKLYAWCIMSNHIHLILAARDNNLSDLLRDFKKFTAKQLIKTISENKQESRKGWMLPVLVKPARLTAGIVNTSFSYRIIILLSCIVLLFVFRN